MVRGGVFKRVERRAGRAVEGEPLGADGGGADGEDGDATQQRGDS